MIDLEKAEHYCVKLIEAALDKLIQPPAIAIPKFMLSQYSEANQLDEDQMAIVGGIHTWSNVPRLHAVHVRLQNYIKAVRNGYSPTQDPGSQSEQASPGYVAQ